MQTAVCGLRDKGERRDLQKRRDELKTRWRGRETERVAKQASVTEAVRWAEDQRDSRTHPTADDTVSYEQVCDRAHRIGVHIYICICIYLLRLYALKAFCAGASNTARSHPLDPSPPLDSASH